MRIERGLKFQLLFCQGLLVAIMVATMGGAVAGFIRLGHSIDRILVDNYKSVVAAQDMKETLERQDSAATFFLAGQVDKARRQYQANWPRFAAAADVEAHNITEPGEQEMADDMLTQFAAYRTSLERLLYATPPQPPQEARAYYFSTLEPAFARLKQRAQDVLDINQAAIVRANARAETEAHVLSWCGILVTLVSSTLALLVATRMTDRALAPLRELSRQAEDIGRGHLEQRIDLSRGDELGVLAQSFHQMSQKLVEARRLEEQRLHRAERMSEAALESLYDPVVVTDASDRVLYVNRAAESLFGPSSSYVGHSLADTAWGSRIGSAIRRAVETRRSGRDLVDEEMDVSLGEERRTYRLRTSLMRETDDVVLGATAVLEDITHLRELDRLKAEFIGVASHELRTPVTSLVLATQILLEGAAGPLTPEQRPVVEAQYEDLSRLQALMRALLDTTRLESGASPPRKTPTHPGALIRAALDSLRHEAEAAGITLQLDFAEGLPEVGMDGAQMTRVLLNLVGNALRHTPRGGSITCAVRPDGEDLAFSVRDTGTGIPRAYLPRIFERFVQVPGATRGGAGLGLSIARQIVRGHNGRIWAESEAGRGTTFSFTIPLESTGREG